MLQTDLNAARVVSPVISPAFDRAAGSPGGASSVKANSGIASTDAVQPSTDIAYRQKAAASIDPNGRPKATTQAAAVRPALRPYEIVNAVRDIAYACGLFQVGSTSAEALRKKFPELYAHGFHRDQMFAVDPNSDKGKLFYRQLTAFAEQNCLAVVGIGQVNVDNHPFALAPADQDGLGGQLMQTDGRDPVTGTFKNGKRTRTKPGDPNFGTAFTDQIRSLFLVPKAMALAAGNAKYIEAKQLEDVGVNCSYFATDLLAKLRDMGAAGFENAEALRAYVKPTGEPRRRGFAQTLVVLTPVLVLQHTNPDWQRELEDPKRGAYQASGHWHTAPMKFTASYHDAVQS